MRYLATDDEVSTKGSIILYLFCDFFVGISTKYKYCIDIEKNDNEVCSFRK